MVDQAGHGIHDMTNYPSFGGDLEKYWGSNTIKWKVLTGAANKEPKNMSFEGVF
jgi:hypothetical protein